MKEKFKKDYLNYLFFRTRINLNSYQIRKEDSELFANIFLRLIKSDNFRAELFILINIKEFKGLGKYFIYIMKKLEDRVINFENLHQNIETDIEYIQNEILTYLSNPSRKITEDLKFQPEKSDAESKHLRENSSNNSGRKLNEIKVSKEESTDLEDNQESGEEESIFRKNYLELIQSDEEEEDNVYELPLSGNKNTGNNDQPEIDLPNEEALSEAINKTESAEDRGTLNSETTPEENINPEFTSDKLNEDTDKAEEDDGENISGFISEEELVSGNEKGIINNEKAGQGEKQAEERIELSEEIQEELNLFHENGEITDDDEETEPGDQNSYADNDTVPANTLFVEYEINIREQNRQLESAFVRMIELSGETDSSRDLNSKEEVNGNEEINGKEEIISFEEQRVEIITKVIITSKHLEELSRNMSLEIISNIYQTITLSFEKISESKYDIAESTLNLYRKGLTLVISLINGDNYFGYKDILKSIENIRNTLLEEKEKREIYLKRLRDKLDAEKNTDKDLPDEPGKEKIKLLRKYILDTENNFKSLEKITGDYQIYEALRSLSGSLNNLKDIVKLSRELKLKKLVQLSEAGYIFIKFLQNYRINPVTEESKEIFGYLIHNLKLTVTGRNTDDIGIFISYLNDPVKIFSKPEKKKN